MSDTPVKLPSEMLAETLAEMLPDMPPEALAEMLPGASPDLPTETALSAPTSSLSTIEALMARVRVADPEEVERCLTAAAAQAGGFHDWEKILNGLPDAVPRERRQQLAAQALRSAREREEIWGFKTVAVLQAHALAEPAVARATLAEAERMLDEMARKDSAFGFYWGILAEAFKVALDDASEARRALLAGWDLAWGQRDVENLGRLVNMWAKHVDPAEAGARLRLVEEAARGWGDLGGVIYWWHALGDAAAGRRVRQAALDNATNFATALDLARYWDLYDKDLTGIDAAFARAEALAQTPLEWLELATLAYSKDENVLARRALDRAAAGVAAADGTSDGGPAVKAQIAAAYVDMFEDEAAADRVGPRGLPPDELRPRQSRLDGWDSSAAALLDWLRARVTPAQLTDISEADYGQDADRHLSALTRICETGLVPLELDWHPAEVLALTRWSSGETVDHMTRGLSCVLLCLAAREDDLANTGPPLVESCLTLGGEAPLLCERLLVWKYETADPEYGEAQFCLTLLFLLRAAREPGDPRLAPLLRRLADAPGVRTLREGMADSLRAEVWKRFIDDILTPLHHSQPALSPLLAAIGFPP